MAILKGRAASSRRLQRHDFVPSPDLERARASGWQPKFLQPVDGAQSAEGAVFLTSGRNGEVVWVMSRYDEAAGAIDYVYMLAGRLVTRINVRLSGDGKRSLAIVTYRLTALNADGERLVDEFDRSFAPREAHWQEAINHLLKTGKPLVCPGHSAASQSSAGWNDWAAAENPGRSALQVQSEYAQSPRMTGSQGI